MKIDIEEVIPEYKDRLYAAAYGICQNREDAEDAVQETFLKYYLADREFQDEDHRRAWLLRVAINAARDITRSFYRSHRATWQENMQELFVQGSFVNENNEELFAAVMKLPERYRIVLHLYYFEDYSIREIADITGSREGTVKSLLSRGRNKLKKELDSSDTSGKEPDRDDRKLYSIYSRRTESERTI